MFLNEALLKTAMEKVAYISMYTHRVSPRRPRITCLRGTNGDVRGTETTLIVKAETSLSKIFDVPPIKPGEVKRTHSSNG